MVQVWAPPIARSGPSAEIRWCEHCDRGSVGKVDVVDKSGVPANTHLFMLKDAPDFLVLSEKLVSYIEGNKFSGLRYLPILCE